MNQAGPHRRYAREASTRSRRDSYREDCSSRSACWPRPGSAGFTGGPINTACVLMSCRVSRSTTTWAPIECPMKIGFSMPSSSIPASTTSANPEMLSRFFGRGMPPNPGRSSSSTFP